MIDKDIGGLLVPPEIAEWIDEEVRNKGLIYISWAWSEEEQKWIVFEKVYKDDK